MLQITRQRSPFLEQKLAELLNADALRFSLLTPGKVPKSPGVYVISALIDGEEVPYYIGRTKNLSQRLYNNHLMGPLSNARLKKYLIESGEASDRAAAKEFILCNCQVRWLTQEGYRERGAIEGYATGVLFPKHGIYEEH